MGNFMGKEKFMKFVHNQKKIEILYNQKGYLFYPKFYEKRKFIRNIKRKKCIYPKHYVDFFQNILSENNIYPKFYQKKCIQKFYD